MKPRFTEDSWRREPWFKQLCNALKSQRTEEDMANLLRDLCTLKELQDLSERYEVARNLAKGLSYRQVAKLTGASTTTVTRVARFLENGEGGYRKVLRTHRHHRMLSDRSSDSKIATITKERSEPTSVLEKYLRK